MKHYEIMRNISKNPPLTARKGVNQVVTRFTPFFTPKNQLRTK